MKRILVSQDDLLNWMNSRLAEYEECNDCRFTSVLRLREEDDYGCNWSTANLRCSGVPVEVCQPIARRIIYQAMLKFNIE